MKPEGDTSLTQACIDIVDAIFECMDNRLFMMPVTIRIMLKFALGL